MSDHDRLVLGVRRRRRSAAALFFCCALAIPASTAGRDIRVDPDDGVDANDGVAAPVRTIAAAIRLAGPGDTVHLQPRVYRDYAAFYNSHGQPGRPIVLDGHGATLDGCDPIRSEEWREVAPGLFRHDDLTELTEAMIDRWFFLWNGEMNRMGRVSKAPSPPLKDVDALAPGEWTFVKDPDREAPAGYIKGAFYIRLQEGQSLADMEIAAPIRPAGVLIATDNSHLHIRNLTATQVYNDGFNISGTCQAVRLENVRAIDCGDDGISAHTDSQFEVDGFVSIGNATGICDTGVSETSYRNVFIAQCLAHDLFFIQNGQYAIENAVVLSSAHYAVTLDTLGETGPCQLKMKNVLVDRKRGSGSLSVAQNCELVGERLTLRNLDVIATGGTVRLSNSFVGGQVPPEGCPDCSGAKALNGACSRCGARLPELSIAENSAWTGGGNVYRASSIRYGATVFSPDEFSHFQSKIGSEKGSTRLGEASDHSGGVGIDAAALGGVPLPAGYAAPWRSGDVR